MIDILAIRDRLNELPFHDGKRHVCLGRISDHVDIKEPESETDDVEEWRDSPEVLEYLQQVQDDLNEHNLSLARSEEDPDVLYAVQPLRQSSEFDLSWMADEMNWVSRITTVAVVMIGPGIIGTWLDSLLGTTLIGVVGLLIGVPLALWYLTLITKRQPGDAA